LKAQLEKHCLDTSEPSPKVFGASEGEAQDEMRVVVFLALISESLINDTASSSRIGGQREVFLQERFKVCSGFSG
jgi:hypothetical protein